MTDEQIIKAFEAEIKSLKQIIERLGRSNTSLLKKKCKASRTATKIIKSEAIKEFAERLKNTNKFYDCIMAIRNVDKADCVFNTIDNLVKEMTEVQE